MRQDSYTHLTIAITSGERPQVRVAFYTPGLRADVRTLETGRPYLVLETGEAYVSISTTGAGPAIAKDVETARRIFDAAARYLADCETHARRPAGRLRPARPSRRRRLGGLTQGGAAGSGNFRRPLNSP